MSQAGPDAEKELNDRCDSATPSPVGDDRSPKNGPGLWADSNAMPPEKASKEQIHGGLGDIQLAEDTFSPIPNTEGKLSPSDRPSLQLEPDDEHDDPEGGLQAWLVVLGAWGGMFASFGIANSFGAIQAYISENQLSTHSPDEIGWIFSLWTFFAFFGGIYIGSLFDIYGPRWLIFIGSVLSVLSMLLLGICTEYWHFLLDFGVLGGIGASFTFTPSLGAVGHWFNRGRGNATGVAATGGAFGGIIYPLLLQSLTPRIGFAWTTRIIGFILLFCLILANLLVRSRLPPPTVRKSPHPDFRIFSQPVFVWTVLAVFLLEWALFIPLTYLTSYALEEGFDTAFAFQTLPILNVGSIFGRWLPGMLSDKIGRFNSAIIVAFATVFVVLAVWLPFGGFQAGLIVFCLFYGFVSGSGISLPPVCIGQLCAIEDYGRYYATCYSVVSIGALTGVSLAGAIIDRGGGKYWGTILFTGCCYIGSLASFIVARTLGGSRKIAFKY
jgi:MFS family permease